MTDTALPQPLLVLPCSGVATTDLTGPDGELGVRLLLVNPVASAHIDLTSDGLDELINQLRAKRAAMTGLALPPDGLVGHDGRPLS
jgi:hypothetical protein